jgi:hypothetical protein
MLLGEAKAGSPGSGGASPSYGVYLRRVCVNLPLILALTVDLDLGSIGIRQSRLAIQDI